MNETSGSILELPPPPAPPSADSTGRAISPYRDEATTNTRPSVDVALGEAVTLAPSAATWSIGCKAWFLALLGWTTVVCFYGLGGGADFLTTDAWVAQTAREMLDRGDWLVPWFSGEMRMQKSPGPYWVVMFTSLIRGTPVDAVSARLPSAVSGVLFVATVFWLARRIGGERAAIFAGFATASSAFLLEWSHRAASDLGLAMLVAVSLAAVWVAAQPETDERRRRWLWLLAYGSAGVGMLYKMPMPVVCVGLPAVLYVVLCNHWRILRTRWHVIGLLVFVLSWAPWAVAVAVTESTAVAKWRLEFFSRFTGELPNVQGQTAWQFYLMYPLAALVFCLPYSLSLPASFARAFRSRPSNNRDGRWFLLIWFFSHLAFFTASVGKETRYFLPALPPLFIMLGCELSALFDSAKSAMTRWVRWGTLAVWIGVPAGLAAGLWAAYRWREEAGQFTWPEVATGYAGAAILFGMGACLAAWLFRQGRREMSFGVLVGTMWVTWLWAWPMLMPIVNSAAPFIDFAEQVNAKLSPEQRGRLRYVASPDPRITWYGDLRVPRVLDQLEMLEAQGGQRSLQTEERLIGEEMFRRLSSDEPVLFLATRSDYIRFLMVGPKELSEPGRPFPASYLWIQTATSYLLEKHNVIFGNQPPPWPEPALELPRAFPPAKS